MSTEKKLSVADYNFYFYRSYYEFLNNVGTDETGMYSSPQADVPLSEQYMDEEKNVTWQDYFDSRAQTLLKDTYAYYHLAQNAGFTLSEEMLDDIQYDYDEKIWFEAVEVGHSTEADYLAQNYGAGMTKDIYMKNLTVLYTAKFYKDFYRENIEITPEELDAYYASHAQDYRSVYYQLFYLSGASSGGMEAAKQHAQELAEPTRWTSLRRSAKHTRSITMTKATGRRQAFCAANRAGRPSRICATGSPVSAPMATPPSLRPPWLLRCLLPRGKRQRLSDR